MLGNSTWLLKRIGMELPTRYGAVKVRPHYDGSHIELTNIHTKHFIFPLKKIVDKLLNYSNPPSPPNQRIIPKD